MNEKTLRTLEFDKITAMLAAQAVSPQGKEISLALQPAVGLSAVSTMLRQTTEACDILAEAGASPINGFEDVRGILGRIRVESVLSMKELLRMAGFLQAVRLAKAGIGAHAQEEGLLAGYAEALTPARNIEEELFEDILSEDEMSDSASPALRSIRQQIRAGNESVREKLNALVRTLEKDGVLQDGIITIRNDRYVLPVLSASKNRVPGIVHDQSASGQTLFIEPMAVVEINNRIKQLHLDERDEIERILERLSGMLWGMADALESDCRIMAQLDFIFAKAKLSGHMNATAPELNEEGYLELKAGRHPLLDQGKVVPVNVWLGREFTQLLITGPNTGGKTVTLKTIGLFALMTQSGLHIPALPGSSMPVFNRIFADIGDEQSIEQNLSTFSSHMKNIAGIMQAITPDSLVLLDELGAGTDPTEGAALAMSILEELRRRRIRTVVTSHYSELKAYSLSHAGTENASVEFDVASLMPTYRLLVGVPGNSNAFLISAKLGLDKYLIDRARSYVNEDSRKLEKVLTNAEAYRATAQSDSQRAEQLRLEMDKRSRELENRKNEIERQKERILEKARREADEICEKAEKKANAIIEEMRQLQAQGADGAGLFAARDKRRQLQQLRVREEKPAAQDTAEKISFFLPGMPVHVLSLGQDGILLKVPNDKGKARVQLGILQMDVSAADLARAKEQKPEKKPSSVHVERSHPAVPMSIDLRGQLCDEAIANLDLYLEAAWSGNLGTVTVIHGKGTGALRSAVNDFLRHHAHVAAYRPGAYGEGDAGVTVVELK